MVPHWPALSSTFRPLSLLLSVCLNHGLYDLMGYLIHGFFYLRGYLIHGFYDLLDYLIHALRAYALQSYGCPIFAN